MVYQHDYDGRGEAQLVPGTLRAFRHFIIHNGELCSLAYKTPYFPVSDEDTRLLAKCNRNDPFGFFGPVTSPPYAPSAVPEKHPAPDRGCKCGFYASYDPKTDFYYDMKWQHPGEYHSTLNDWEMTNDEWGLFYYRIPYVVLRAVVEMSGRIIMGGLGVRAEKMRVTSLALDWTKHAPPLTGLSTPHPAVAEAVAVADAVGARFYESLDAMHADHPKSDVSALGVEELPPDTGEKAMASYAQNHAQAQLVQARNTHKQITSLKQAFTDLAKALDAHSSPDDSPEESEFDRLMRMKRNKPAPPGTGIDRRKKKL